MVDTPIVIGLSLVAIVLLVVVLVKVDKKCPTKSPYVKDVRVRPRRSRGRLVGLSPDDDAGIEKLITGICPKVDPNSNLFATIKGQYVNIMKFENPKYNYGCDGLIFDVPDPDVEDPIIMKYLCAYNTLSAKDFAPIRALNVADYGSSSIDLLDCIIRDPSGGQGCNCWF